MPTTNTSRPATLTAVTMTVTVRDTEAEARNWGSSRGGIVTRTVTISANCPRCGGRRATTLSGHNFCEDGEWAWVQRWNNPCGHLDMYDAVLVEAATLTGVTERILGRQRHANQSDPAFDEVERIAAQIGETAFKHFAQERPAVVERVCVTCELPIVLLPGSSTRYEHLITRYAVDNRPIGHPAEPKLAHPMDGAPFAGIAGADDDAGEFLAGLAASVHAKQDRGLTTHTEVNTDASTEGHPDESELPVSLATFQQCVADGAWTCKTSGDEEAGQ